MTDAEENESSSSEESESIERETKEDSNTQEEDPGSAPREEINENPNAQNETEHVNVDRLCLDCNEYQEASTFESHRATRHKGVSRLLHGDIVGKLTLRKQGGNYMVVPQPNQNDGCQSETRNDANETEEALRAQGTQEKGRNKAAEKIVSEITQENHGTFMHLRIKQRVMKHEMQENKALKLVSYCKLMHIKMIMEMVKYLRIEDVRPKS